MPNWCENQLSITGKPDDMKPFLEKIRKVNGDYRLLEALYPTPKDLLLDGQNTYISEDKWTPEQKANHEKYGYADWYFWRIDKWGTKWQEDDLYLAQDYHVNDRNGLASIAFSFNSAWSPPIEAFNKIAADYPNLLFTLYYEEPGMGYCGSNVWAKGECVQSEHADLIGRYFDEDYLFEHYYNK
jgi:hypothetical protein